MYMLELSEETLNDVCATTDVEPEPERLLQRINERLEGDLKAHHMLSEEDWYRVGGVVDKDGVRISDDLMDWVEKESEDNIERLIEKHHSSGYQATALIGRTHYFAIPVGTKPMDFYQIEIDEVEEVIERPLFQDDFLPDSLEEVIDPMDAPHFEPHPYGAPRYQPSRLINMLHRIWDLTNDYTGDPGFRRFIEEWGMSSAAKNSCFCNHWVLKERPYLSENGDHITEVKVLTPLEPLIYGLRGSQVEPGSELQATVQQINEKSGYAMTWYYMMVTQNFLPYGTVNAIYETLLAGEPGYGEASKRDLRILENWLDDPYHT
ncbi:hypothetical protein [Magnetospira sp. QH-2]|uniref:hypothetical protein n=1 Tax=Magnetospira sp. (strain QH-2) TaxID=1288970 RepID=UPI0003E80B28|nr:hypothetical protein [Magnetospira sp. QH-2]CCQ72917.1 conserved protein of unknown function [Magnetospira sp. QH-2]